MFGGHSSKALHCVQMSNAPLPMTSCQSNLYLIRYIHLIQKRLLLSIGNWALGSYCLAVTQAKHFIVFVCPKAQSPIANDQLPKQLLLNWVYMSLTLILPGGGGGVLRYIVYQVCAAPKGIVFEPFWSENGYIDFDNFCLQLGQVCAR